MNVKHLFQCCDQQRVDFTPLGKKSPSSPSKSGVVESDVTSIKNHLYRSQKTMQIHIWLA